MKKINLSYSLLLYDIETTHLFGRFFRLGEQTIRHTQLLPYGNTTNIISISYKWFHEHKIHALDFRDENMISKFDAEAKKADVIIGKNSDRFDSKHINTQRMLLELQPLDWLNNSDDLEKQLRKYFNFPSQSLDYISNLLGFGGKNKMEEEDWASIEDWMLLRKLYVCSGYDSICPILFEKSAKQVERKGKQALIKMITYNKKDVLDTENVLRRVLSYIKLKNNAATAKEGKGCVVCGSNKIVTDRIITKGQTKYQLFNCLSHGGAAGKATYRWDKFGAKKIYGKIIP